MATKSSNQKSLYDALLTCKTPKEMEAFIKNLLSPKEILRAKVRWEIACTFFKTDCTQAKAKELHEASNELVYRVHKETASKKETGYRKAYRELFGPPADERGQP